MKLVLASHNTGKLAELRGLLAGSGIEVVPQSDFGIGEIEEPGLTFVENALLKARHAARISDLPALADDSGLCVEALGGAPGLYSSRYAGSDGDAQANILKLLDALADVPDEHRGAHFHCTLALLRHAEDPAPLVCEGRWHGRILHDMRGDGGFGYDPVFFDPATGQTAAELSRDEKAAISHRGQALRQLIATLSRHPL
ncbi:RdgB/HAM1 family non-canonical purine NTP pyrophosphatase [Xanthomonadaceae bacterium XH05]|nr:RdgB/HAM1 family non-canonical purine NTP pyrophosphatase [Xanthomonadaceae bacterium XH05]